MTRLQMKLNTRTLTPDDFVKRWQKPTANEKQSYHEHFRDVCRLVGGLSSGEQRQFDDYTFEYGLKNTDGWQGDVDVFYRNHFALECEGRKHLSSANIRVRNALPIELSTNEQVLLDVAVREGMEDKACRR